MQQILERVGVGPSPVHGVAGAVSVAHNEAREITIHADPSGRSVIFGRRGGSRPVDEPVDPRDPTWREDAALVAQALVDAEAFGVLYDRYCDPIHRYVSRRLFDPQGADDITADVFFKALRALDTYQPHTAPFSAWLYRIAANTVVDVLRSRRPTAPLDEASDLADPAISVEQRVIDRAEVARVWAAVERLTPAQRSAVTLRLGQDLPIAEIAARMSRSEGAVKLLLNRGLSAVREDLRAAGTASAGDEEVRR